MTEKTASVHWEGQGKQGQGKISTETGALKQYPYGFASRFEDDRRGTNPEELLGAAHAACFTMAFSFACDKAGLATTDVDTMPACAFPGRVTASSSIASLLPCRPRCPASTMRSSRRSPPRPSSTVLCRRHLPAFRISPFWQR